MINVTAYNLNQPSKVAFGNSEKPAVKYTPKQLPTAVFHQKPSSGGLMRGFKALIVGTAATVATVFGGGCSSEIDAPTPPSPIKPGTDTAIVIKPQPDTRTVSEKAFQWADSLGIKPTVTTKAGTFSDGDSIVFEDQGERISYGMHPNAKGDTVYMNTTSASMDGLGSIKGTAKMYQRDGKLVVDDNVGGKLANTFELIKDGLKIKRNEFGKTAYIYKPTANANEIIKTVVEDGVNEMGSRIVKIPYYLRK